ncbi:latrophilin Cirl isoform X2 [Nasonia vitripennis]|uniref:Latrophilin Cirl n=1 Tax=Nasonia vitripennis TaxID=7425 RepID=A0A7M7Q5M6_NASVI|nr:latrophilin Cirl isoform X2 [Nasonia vitripennis]
MESRKGRWKALQLILAWFYISGCSTVLARNVERYDTAYECEGKTLRIECREGELIHLIRANYGRFSITICNEHGNTDWSVNCMSPKSFRVLYSKCNGRRSCELDVRSENFVEDPCPGTSKYIEAQYDCLASTTTTTTRPSPPWLLTSVRSTGPLATQATTASSVSGNGRSPSRITTPARAQPAQSASSASSTVAPSASSAPSRPSSTRPWTDDESIEDEEDEDEEEVVAPPPDDAIRPLEPAATQEPTQQPPFTSSTLPPWKTNRRTPTGNVYNGNSGQHHHGPFCSAPGVVRKLSWHETRVNNTAEQSCPEGTTGMAYWRCLPGRHDDEPGVWERKTPDLKDCRSVWLTSLARSVQEGELILKVSSDLSQVTSNSSNLYGGDMLITTQIIRNMTDKMAKDISAYQDPRQKVVSVEELLQGAVTTSSNLLDQSESWNDLNHTDQRIVASSLLQGLEENAFLLADTLTYEKRTNYSRINNILMEVWVLDVRSLENEVVVFPSEQHRKDKWAGLSVELASSLLGKVSSKDGFVRLVFMAFDRLEKILKPQSNDDFPGQQLSINEQREPAESSSSSSSAAAQQLEQKQKQRANTSSILNSKVISASLSGGRHIKLPEGEFVKLHLKHLEKSSNYTNPRCVFWNFTANDWSEEGCIKRQSNATHTVCECNHLTNFAILMDWNDATSTLSAAHQMTLHIITYIGCIISVVCLFLAIITFQLFRGLKSDRTTIHKNLCICLFIAEVVFICGIEQTWSKTLCGIVAGLLHFFFLCAFAWMFLEGFQLYVMLIEVFEAEKSRLRWYYLVAYGAPLLVVGISCVIDSSGYGTDDYCWLSADNYFIFSFVGPVILVILANLVFLSMAIYMMCRHANTTVSMKSKEHSRLASASGKEENALPNKLQAHLAWLRGAIVLVFLLGLTWTFGLLYLNKKSVIMAYIFTVLNSLQGLFIFVFHCVQNEKVRKEYRKFIRRHSWLPKCLRCSKGSSGGGSGGSGAGGTGANGSHGNSHGGGAGKDFASHNTSSNPSAPTTDSSGLSPHANSNYLVSTGQRGGWGTLQREHHAASPGSVPDAASDSSPCPTPQPAGAGGHAVSTLPYARHHHHHLQYQQQQHHQQLQQQQLHHHHHHQPHHASTSLYPQAPNIPKSATATWGPLNKNLTWKNISFKSQSRDSGHGGSEQEDSPRVLGGQPGYGHSAMTLQGYSLRARERRLLGELEVGSRATTGRRAASPYNHTYTEIRDARHQQHYAQQHGYGLSQHMQDDPVYEEIERAQGVLGIGGGCPEAAQAASDMSDEDGRRQSDMSRQSSRSYGDHRPLIPYSPAAERSLEAAWALEKLRRQHQASSRPELEQQQQQLRPQAQLQHQHQQLQQQQQDHTRTVAVLDGHTVVCHLQPQAELYAARGLAPPSYSEC